MKNFYFINEQRGDGETPPPTPKRKPKPAPKKVKTKTTTKTFTPVDISRDEMSNGTKEVSEGMKGNIVGYIQAALDTNLKPFNIKVTLNNTFDEETRKAVVRFQQEYRKDYNLTVTGKVDKATYSALMEGSDWVCKTDVKKSTDVEKSTDVKPTEIRKKLKPLNVISPEKYIGKIKEQVDDIAQGIRNLKGIGGATSYKPATKSAAPPVNPEQILKRVINTGCINSLKKEIGFELYGKSQPKQLNDGRFAIVGVNYDNEEFIYLYSDGKGQKDKVDANNKPIETERIEWECASFKKTTSLTADGNRMSDDQKAFVDAMVKNGNGLYTTEKPSEEQPAETDIDGGDDM
jgi:peptidoglycan hydrolase-like protein with peptidoglycan-binding domain